MIELSYRVRRILIDIVYILLALFWCLIVYCLAILVICPPELAKETTVIERLWAEAVLAMGVGTIGVLLYNWIKDKLGW